MRTTDDTLAAVADHLREAERILFLTGAGISADSGLPTYRGVGGLYERVDTEEGVPIEIALSGAMFRERPALTWKYLWEIGAACRGATFNRGHKVIALIEKRKPATWVVTQNVDGFHRAAGSRQVVEIHGRMSDLRCTACAYAADAEAYLRERGGDVELPPRCPTCGSVIRPDVVLFGEMLPDKAVEQFATVLAAGPDLVLSVGTSALFPYIVEPVFHARARGVPTVEINPTSTEISDVVEHRIERGAADALDRLWTLLDAS